MRNIFFLFITVIFVITFLFLFKSKKREKLYVITGNKNKFTEIKRVLPYIFLRLMIYLGR